MIESNKSRKINLTNSLLESESNFSLDSESGDNYILDTSDGLVLRSTPYTDFQKISDFLGSNNLVIEEQKNHQISYLFNIENNKNNKLEIEIVDDIKDYKRQANNNLHDQFDIFSSKVFDSRKNAKIFLESITKKYNKFNSLKLKIEKGIEEKQENVITKNFANKIKKYITNKEDSYFFNLTTNYFNNSIDNVSLLNNKNIKPFANATLYKNNSNNTFLNIEPSKYKDHLFLAFDNNSNWSLQTFSNGFVVQNIVTMIRNLFFLSPNSFKGNIPSNISSKNIFNNFDKNSFVVCLSEREGLNIFKNINAKTYEINTLSVQKDLRPSRISANRDLTVQYRNSSSNEHNYLKNIGVRFDYIYKEGTQADRNNAIISFRPIEENTSNQILTNTQFPLWYISQDNSDYITLTQIHAVKKKVSPFNKDILSQEFSFLNNFPIPFIGLVTGVADDLKAINDMFYGKFFNQSIDNAIFPVPLFNFSGNKLAFIKQFTFQMDSIFRTMFRSPDAKRIFSGEFKANFFESLSNASSIKNVINNIAFNNQVIYYKNEPVIIYNTSGSVSEIDLSQYNRTALQSINIDDEYIDFTDISGEEAIIKCYPGEHNNLFKVDMPNIKFSELKHKILIDNIVKFSKLKYAVNKGFNVQLVDSVLKNINSSTCKNFMLAFSKENSLNNIAIVDKECEVYDLLFTESEDKTYSNVDLVSEVSINGQTYKDLNHLKKDNIDTDVKFFEKADMIKGLLSNYYPRNNIFSSSVLFRNIVKSIVDESKIENPDHNKNLTQSLYFHYINSETRNEDAKKLIAKRFIKKAIQKDTICKSNFSNSNLDSFSYKPEQIDFATFDETSKSSIKNYIDKCLQTSSSLNLLKNTVFSHENINSLSELVRFKRVNNIDITERTNRFYVNNPKYNINSENNNLNAAAGGSGLPPTSDYFIGAVILYNILPNYCMLYDFYSKENIQNDSRLELKIQSRNKIDEKIVYGQENEIGIKEIISENYSVDKSIENFDVTFSNKIQLLVNPIVNADFEIYNRTNDREKPYILVEDMFDNIFDYDNETEKNSHCFNKIIDIIQDILRLSVKDYLNLEIENESNIDSIIDSNNFLVEKTLDVLKVFASIYDNYTYRLQRHRSVCVFKNMSNIRINDIESNADFPRLGYVSTHQQSFNKYNKIYSDDFTDRAVITHDENILSDLGRIINYYDLNHNDLYESDLDTSLSTFKNEISFTDFFTDFSEMIFVTLRDLHVSDFYQALNFDIVNSTLNYVNEVSEKSYEEIFESTFIDEIDEVEDAVKEKINNNFYNMYFLNKLSKGLAEIESHNESNIKLFREIYQNSNFLDLKNLEGGIFKNSRETKETQINNILGRVSNNSFVQKECFGKNTESYLNSNFTVLGLKENQANHLNNESLIIVTANIVDKFNLNRFYIPKVFIFSGIISGNINSIVNDITKDDIYSNFKNENLANLIGYFNVNENLNARFSAESVNLFIEGERHPANNSLGKYLKDVISKKFIRLQRQILSMDYTSPSIPSPGPNIPSSGPDIPSPGFDSTENTENDQSSQDSNQISYNSIINLLAKHTINCHISSEEGKKIISGIYNTDVFSSFYSSKKISLDIFNLLKNINKKPFYAIFGQEKDKIINNLVFDESELSYVLPDNDVLSHDSFVYLLLENLENIIKLDQINDVIFDEFYEKYVVAINPRDFVYIDLNENTKNIIAEGIEEEFIHTENKLFISLCRILELDEVISEVDGLAMKFKKSLSEIDNFEIVLKVEVI